MDIFKKATELGELIAESEQMKNLKDAEIGIECDDYAQELLTEYKQLQMDMAAAARDSKSREVIESFKGKLESKMQEIKQYEATGFYIDSKAAFDKLMKTINEVIIFSITGEAPCSSKDCGSCSGCK